MSLLLGILLTLLILSFVVFVHEMGHFLTARLTRMKVEEFGIGIPPKAKTLFRDRFGTSYTLNWLPIGGFVRIKGEDAMSAEAGDNDSFAKKRWWARSLVLVAGVAMNFLLAWAIFTVLLWRGASPLAVNYLLPENYGSYFLPSIEESITTGFLHHDGIEIEPLPSGPAMEQGIGKGDILFQVDGFYVRSIDEFTEIIKRNTPMELTLRRAGNEKSIYTVGILPDNGKIKAYLRYHNIDITKGYRESFTFGQAAKKGIKETYILSKITFHFLGKTLHDLIRPKEPIDREIAKEMIAGPIGMGAGMVELVKIGFGTETLLLMIAFISVNLGVLNILPFPALDGGRLVSTSLLSFIGLFTKRKKSLEKIEQIIHTLGMVLLIGLSLVIAFLDILKL